MSKVLITGCGGFTGRHLADAMAANGHEVHALVHEGENRLIPSAQALHRCDVTDQAALSRLVRTISPDQVVHLAAISFAPHDDLAEMYRTNILGTRNLLGALAQSPIRPEAVLVASSANIYGHRGGRLTEDMPAAPFNDYGVTKATTEIVCGLFSEQLPIILVRPFNYTGLGQSAEFLIPKIVDHARRGIERIELGNIDVERDFSDVRTVIDAYQRLLATPDSQGGVFNVCSGRPIALRQVLNMVGELAGHRFDPISNPAFIRPNEPASLCGDPQRLEHMIGPLRTVPIAQTLKWMLND
ncbi:MULTISPECIES: NAD-dependent epimerase/dehydratase family protein [Sphingobium]|uniref:GDP-6-deoxy-D-lyxo-4-hexulose reductase n=1 Tax=Sphingobium cupriresistens LL01 TaxID=1420583 RepID=A0A0J7XZX2_9SPHN|nr:MULTISPECIES: NAD-dependent epimerase/dehydratase family protein [Sphingobium]KMS57221.1 GDP-6-deoxy-D-lyxo-4-hexulose reductase [Sphingobium cupriresistens LL01]MBJ7376468.1 NAD-dependent epimerase/dehydratase family protein [Sphingobium sp.]WCP14222.1 GDP-6-deoxy-D-talose 4-dehydrogenase [Sphingobium sp. AntQ-1]